ncbi:MAG: TetR/AcrR family transcriptional regulator [Lachnospiraceae bacterium]|nr:TetR/AcrR family transcriptional regulator [Erysipelotrichaceae bacterium]MBR2544624.1 TetR/AcrR family transcriptional regulator [Erysipelotrichaceae bacterium]MBR2544670.1 TetR/AcrR family transcriptional regulator [Erysipelotrichaceae bacterium]MBR4341952.1 TetR/AcrR family transcriptional regulator [Lachnospiraceae bacterium]
MPKKPTTTREEMIDGAFELVRTEGHQALTVRSLAAKLGCSTQPIMYQFPNIDELKDLVYEKADLFHTQYLTQTEDFLEIGLRYVRFAHEERNLFRFLFQSGRFDGKNMRELIRDENVQQLIASAASELEMNREQAADAFEALFAMVHGYGALVADNALEYDQEAIRRALIKVAQGMMKG